MTTDSATVTVTVTVRAKTKCAREIDKPYQERASQCCVAIGV